MKRIVFIISAMVISVAMYAQKDSIPAIIDITQGLEDSDLLVNCADYYTGKLLVRSSDEVYQVKISSNHYLMLIDNNHNENNVQVYSRRTGQSLLPEYLHPMKLDMSCIQSILQTVFPLCSFKPGYEEGMNRIALSMRIDPDSCKVRDVSFTFSYLEDDQSILSIPPSRIRQLESLIKEHIVAEYPTAEYARERNRNASVLFANCSFTFTKFDL